MSVRSGSADITAYITPQPVSSTNSTQASSSDPAASSAQLNAMSNSISNGISSSTLNLGFPVINYNLNTVVFNTDGSVYSPTDNP